jgi:hypothetical protein
MIARRPGYSNRSGAWRAVRAGFTVRLGEPADVLRVLEPEQETGLDLILAGQSDREVALRSIERGGRFASGCTVRSSLPR